MGECLEMLAWHEDGLEACLHIATRWFLVFKLSDRRGIRSNKVVKEIVMKRILEGVVGLLSRG